jgi:hypothetical protein
MNFGPENKRRLLAQTIEVAPHRHRPRPISFCLGLVLGMMLLPSLAPSAPSGTWQCFEFTAPASDSLRTWEPVKRYVLTGRDHWGYQWQQPIYDGPSTNSGPPKPNAPGDRDSIWVWLTGDARGRAFFMVSLDSAGNVSEMSNRLIIAATPDSGLFLDDTGIPDRDSLGWKCSKHSLAPGLFIVSFSRRYGDPASTVSEESVLPDKIFLKTLVWNRGPIVRYSVAQIAVPDLCARRVTWCPSRVCP